VVGYSEQTVKGSAQLRASAESKKLMAELARRSGRGLSVAEDRLLVLEHAQELEAEAAELEAQAAALDGPKPR
jgi:DNA-binding transcriptional LysR family regulator